MRHGSSQRRGRKRNNGNRNGNSRTQVFDSNGPDVRIRGTAHQVAEKYEALAKDAASSSDITMEQNYLQHAEHYLRIISAQAEKQKNNRSGNNENRNRKVSKTRTPAKNTEVESDLGLPASILGGEVKVESKDVEAETV